MTTTDAPRFIRVAVLQPELGFGRVMPNLHMLRALCEQTTAYAPLDLLIFPEIFDGNPETTNGANAEQFFGHLARACDAHVIGGSTLVTDESGRSYNRTIVCHRSGEIAGRYDKRILFSSEQETRTVGEHDGVFDLDGIRVGVLICADFWHPELSRAMMGRVDVLAVVVKSSVPTESHKKYARALWRSMALTRAMENGFAVAVSDWADGRHDYGHGDSSDQRTRHTHFTSGGSSIVDPSHRPDMERIQRVLPGGVSGVLRADIRLEALEAYRSYRQRVGLLPDVSDRDWS